MYGACASTDSKLNSYESSDYSFQSRSNDSCRCAAARGGRGHAKLRTTHSVGAGPGRYAFGATVGMESGWGSHRIRPDQSTGR